MKVVTADQIREIDRVSIEKYGIPQAVLMYNAGKESVKFITENFSPKKAVIFCGTGNNGGDGFVASYIMQNSGISCDIILCGDSSKITETSKIYYNLCLKSEIPIVQFSSSIGLSGFDIIIDAITGTGFTGTPRGIIAEAVALINNSKIKTVSLDIPSCMDSDGSAFNHDPVHADATVTMGLPKISLAAYPNKRFCGKIHIADIGFPKELTCSSDIKTELALPEIFSHYLNKNNNDDIHKTGKGTLLLLGGFDGMEGAIMLSAMAAFETGTGLAVLAASEKSREIIAGKIPELITKAIPCVNIEKEIHDIIAERKYDACIIGPGLGRDERASEIFTSFFKSIEKSSIKKVLIDGDGLYHLANIKDKQKFVSKTEMI